MPIKPENARELAELLPDNLSCHNARERLICTAEALRALTDIDHPLSNADLRAVLVARFGEEGAASENTLNDDIKSLRNIGFMGYTIKTGPRGSWCESETLGPSKVRLLLNAVQTSRFLTMSESAELQDSLLGLVSRHQEDDLVGEVHVVQRMGKEGRTVLEACDIVLAAIRTNKKVEFEYAYNNFEGKQVALPGDDGQTLRVETPIALYYSNGNYYLESYSETPWRRDQQITRSRLDRMRGIRVSRHEADLCKKVKSARRTATKRMKREFEMLGGEPRTVFLRVGAEKTNEMFDRFGFGLKFANFEGMPRNKDSTALTCLTIAQSATFFRWLAGMQGDVRLQSPPAQIELVSEPWASLCAGRSRDELVADYEAMRAGYLDYLDCARSACDGPM